MIDAGCGSLAQLEVDPSSSDTQRVTRHGAAGDRVLGFRSLSWLLLAFESAQSAASPQMLSLPPQKNS